MSNGKASTRRTDIDSILKSEVKERELYGITRRRITGVSASSLATGGGATNSGGGGVVGGVGDNLGNHIATQDLDMEFFFMNKYLGWFSASNQADILSGIGMEHYLDSDQHYVWRIGSGVDPPSILWMYDWGLVVQPLRYGLNFQSNFISLQEHAEPGVANEGEKKIFVDNHTGLLSVLQSPGDFGHTVPLEQKYITINYIIDGGAAVIIPGKKGGVWVNFDLEIMEWTISDDSYAGSIVVKVTHSRYADFPTQTTMSSVTTHPTLSGQQKNQGIVTDEWTRTNIFGEGNAGVYIGFNVASASNVRRVTVALKCRRKT